MTSSASSRASRGTVEKARTAANEGWRSLNDMAGRHAGRPLVGVGGVNGRDLSTTNMLLGIMAARQRARGAAC